MSTSTDPREIVIEALNEKYGFALTTDLVLMGEPVLLDASVLDFSDPERRNSTVRVTRLEDEQGPAMDFTLHYNRLSLSKLFASRNTHFDNTDATSVHALLPAISARIGTELTPEDVVDTQIDRSGPNVSVWVSAQPLSYKVIGEVELTLAGEDVGPDPDPDPQPARANRMLFANAQTAKLTDDLVSYQNINDEFAPVVTGSKLALTAGLSDGRIVVVQGDEWNNTLTINYRLSTNEPWRLAQIPGRLWSTYMVVFNDEAYFAMSDPEIDPWGMTCGLYRMKFEASDGALEPRPERVLDLWLEGIEMDIQMAVDPITNVFAVASGFVHITSDGQDWSRMKLPRLYSESDASEMPRVIGLGLYDGSMRVVYGTRMAGTGHEPEWLEFLFLNDLYDLDSGEHFDHTFGPLGALARVMLGNNSSFYYGEEGMFLGYGVVSWQEEGVGGWKDQIGQIWKLNEATRLWELVSADTGIVNGQFVKLENSLVYAGANNDAYGGLLNLVVTYDQGATWVPDPSGDDSPFKLDPRRPASLTAITMAPWEGGEHQPLPEFEPNVRETFPDDFGLGGFKKAVAFGDGYLISGMRGLWYVGRDGQIDRSWTSAYPGEGPTLYPMADGGLMATGAVSLWRGEATTYTRFLRITPEGEIDTSFVEPAVVGGTGIVNLLPLQDGGWLAWGNFTLWAGSPANYVVRLDENFERIPDFALSFEIYTTPYGVTSATQLPDGTILLSAYHHVQRTNRSGWYLVDPVTGVEKSDYPLDLGTGRPPPGWDEFPVLVDAFEDPDTGEFYLFSNQRTFADNAWGMRFNPTTLQTSEVFNGGDMRGGVYRVSTVAFDGGTKIAVCGNYGVTQDGRERRVDRPNVEFFYSDGTMVSVREKPFDVLPHENSGGIADLRCLNLDNNEVLLYGNFGYVNQAPYPLSYRVKSRNLCRLQLPSGLA